MMDPDKALDNCRRAAAAWEDAGGHPGEEHDAGRDMSEAFGALDDWLSHEGFLPRGWGHRTEHRERRRTALEMVREMLAAVSQAMADEGVPGVHRERVMNRLLYGDPEGVKAVQPVDDPDATEVISSHADDAGLQARIRFAPPSRMEHDASVYAAVHDYAPEPSPGAIIFGADSRELSRNLMDGHAWHPLTSSCRCGAQITRLAPGQAWQHC